MGSDGQRQSGKGGWIRYSIRRPFPLFASTVRSRARQVLLLLAGRFPGVAPTQAVMLIWRPRIKRLKRTPEVWQFEVTPGPGFIEQGRKKYERLLKAHAQVQRPAAAAV